MNPPSSLFLFEEEIMYVIAGLGNPGLSYRHTRHNIGFDALDVIAKRYSVRFSKSEFRSKTASCVISGEKVILIKPQTYMNLSGEAIGPLLDFYKADPKTQLIVISDDVALDAGRLRIRKKGSAGGHNGLKNIIKHCGTEDFMRIRIGAGKLPAGQDMISFVLGRNDREERQKLESAFERAADAVELIISSGVDEAMNRFNGEKQEQ